MSLVYEKLLIGNDSLNVGQGEMFSRYLKPTQAKSTHSSQPTASSASTKLKLQLDLIKATYDKLLHPQSDILNSGFARLQTEVYRLATLAEHYSLPRLHNLTRTASKLCYKVLSEQKRLDDAELEKLRTVLGNICSYYATLPQLLPENPDSITNLNQGFALKVILLDDDNTLHLELESQLKPYGYDLIAIGKPARLRQALTEQNVVMLLYTVESCTAQQKDIQIVSELIKATESNCPLIVVSRSDDMQCRLAAVRAGADGYLCKPVDPLQLMQLIKRHAIELDGLGKDPYRLLVIDDDQNVTSYFCRLFESRGFQCRLQNHPFEVLRTLKSFTPDVIILDVNMPGCDGFELAKVIRQVPAYGEIPIIFLTAVSGVESHITGIGSGGDDFIEKGINKGLMIKIVETRAKRNRLYINRLNALATSEARFRTSLSFAKIGLWEWDLAIGKMTWTETLSPMLGFEQYNEDTSFEKLLATIYPDDREMFITAMEKCVHEGENFNFEHRIVWPDGCSKWLRQSGGSVCDDLGKSIRIYSVVQDITEQKSATFALDNALADAEAANQAKSAFLATMSHEIRTPMNGVFGMVDVLAQSKLSTQQMSLVDTIRHSSALLLRLIDDILDVSRIEAGRLDIEYTDVNLRTLLKNEFTLQHQMAENSHVDMRLYIDPQLPQLVKTDELRVSQILSNLIRNAVKFSSNMQHRRGLIKVRVEVANHKPLSINFKVQDNGIGMDEQTTKRVFQRFTQAQSSTTRRYGGSGLGLSICQGLVELLNGELTVQSEPDKGTEMTVALPFEGVESAPLEPWPQFEALSIYVVSKKDFAHEDLVSYLQPTSLKVETVKSNKAALSQSQKCDSPAIVIEYCGNETIALTQLSDLAGQAENRDNSVKLAGNPPFQSTLIDAIAKMVGIEVSADLLAAPTAPPLPKQDHQQCRKILVVEDDQTNRKVIFRQLAILGFESVAAINGAQALAFYQQQSFDLILTDLHMPEMDGYQLCHAIRELEKQNRTFTPIVVLSANALRGESRRAMECGADDYICKPIPLTQLEKVLQLNLEKNRPNQPPQQHNTLFDIDVLKQLVGDDKATLIDFVQAFRQSMHRYAQQISEAGQAGNGEDIVRIAHTLKSSAKAVGAKPLIELCIALEALEPDLNGPQFSQTVARFSNIVAEVDRSINHYLTQQQDP